jgi:hypothetical protein
MYGLGIVLDELLVDSRLEQLLTVSHSPLHLFMAFLLLFFNVDDGITDIRFHITEELVIF